MAALDVGKGWRQIPFPIMLVLIAPVSDANPTVQEWPVENCHEEQAEQTELEGGENWSLDGQTKIFQLWSEMTGGRVPGRDYLLRKTDGTVYAIKEVENLNHGKRFRCHCLKTN